ncbi:MAG: hypothetical protein WC374_02610 [Phycisphaerae bacterium]|jgi:hypothetical protein
MSASEFQVVQDALTGRREADENALAAMAVLEERLERVRAFGGEFSNIGFSSEVKKMRRRSMATVG